MRLVEKLKLNTDAPLWLLNAPSHIMPYFEMVTLKKTLTGKAPIAQALYFANNRETLETGIASLLQRTEPDAVLWIAHPKKSSKLYTNLNRDQGWESLEAEGYVPVAGIGIDDDWSAVRFRKKDLIKKNLLRDTPMEERKTEGVDYVNKTVELPKDAVAAMKPFHGLERFFHNMSFSHKKEYLKAIAEAKRPETRVRRIQNMVAAINKLRAEKDLKKK